MTGRAANITKNTAKEYEHLHNKAASKENFNYHPELLTIKAKIYPQKISYLLDTFICSQVIPHKDGSVTATFTVPQDDWIYELLLSFGPNMKIISPKLVREKVLRLARGVLAEYK